MRKIGCVGVILVLSILGCVESSGPSANSDRGHLYVDLERALAVGWEAEIYVKGPATGQQHCDEQLGCYYGHHTVQMHSVESTDADVVRVEGFEGDSYGQTEAVRLDLEVIGEGEASLEFEFEFHSEQASSAQDVEDDGEESQETAQGEDDGGLIRDSFPVTTGEVSSVRLNRRIDDADPTGPYGKCTKSGPGTYLMQSLDEYAVMLTLEKLDSSGTELRGTGKFPFSVEPEEAVEIDDSSPVPNGVELMPSRFGHVELSPEEGGSSFEAWFVDLADVQQTETAIYELTPQGARGRQVGGEMAVDRFYEVDVTPGLAKEAPLCGGALEFEVESMTPAICEQHGFVETTGNPAVYTANGGECHLRVTLHGAAGGGGLVEEYAFGVFYGQ